MDASDAAQKILQAGQTRTANNLPEDASLKSNPAAMGDKVLKEGARTLASQAAKGQADPQLAAMAQASRLGTAAQLLDCTQQYLAARQVPPREALQAVRVISPVPVRSLSLCTCQ